MEKENSGQRLRELRDSFQQFEEKYKRIRARDLETKTNLIDKQAIVFIDNLTKFFDDEQDIKGVEIDDYKQKNYTLSDSDQIVLAQSKINILFNSPSMNYVTFTIPAKEENLGFTKQELFDKVMQYFIFIKNMNFNYNLDTGEYGEKKGTKMFDTIFDHQWDVGILGLEYNKESDT